MDSLFHICLPPSTCARPPSTCALPLPPTHSPSTCARPLPPMHSHFHLCTQASTCPRPLPLVYAPLPPMHVTLPLMHSHFHICMPRTATGPTVQPQTTPPARTETPCEQAPCGSDSSLSLSVAQVLTALCSNWNNSRDEKSTVCHYQRGATYRPYIWHEAL